MKRRELIWVLGFLLAAAAVFLLPRFVSDFRAQQFAYVGIYFIALLGLNLLTGITGQISLGHGAFMLIGGYTTAILISDQGLKLGSHTFSSDMTDIWTIPIAGLVAGLAGFLFGFPALRLAGIYLALATFAIAVATPAVVRKFEEFTGGGGGINMFGLPGLTGVIDPVTIPIIDKTLSFNEWLYYLSWTIALVMLAVAWLLLRGRFGRSLRAVRDSELAAASSGVNLARYKTLAFGISAFYAGVAGSLLAIATTFVNPDTFPIALSIFLLVGVVVGGLGSLWPLVFGAIFIHFMQIEWAQRVESVIPDWLPLLGDLDTDAPGAPAVAFGVILILIMLVAPGGAAGLLCRLKVRCDSRLPSRSLSLDQGAALTDASTQTSHFHARARRRDRDGRNRCVERGSRDHRQDDPARRHGAAVRPGVCLRVGGPRRERLLQVREHPRRRQRPHDHLQVPRRRLQRRRSRCR